MMYFYFLHKIISKLGNKITSFTLVFILMSIFSKNSLPITVFLFSVSCITNIIFSNLYDRIINKYKSFKILIIFDLISTIVMLAMYLFVNNMVVLFILYFINIILCDLTERYDAGLFYTMTKNTKKESKFYQLSGSIDTILSMVAPAIVAIVINYIGNNKSLLVDSASFFIGAILYFFTLETIRKNPNLNYKEEEPLENTTEEKHIKVNRILEFNNNLKLLSKDFYMMVVIYIFVGLITNMEEPLIFNYLAIERNFSKAYIGYAFSLFSFGMMIGSWSYGYIENRLKGITLLVIVDAICSFLLSLNINFVLIVIFYTIQGVMAMLIIISYKVRLQREFEAVKSYMKFINSFKFIMSIITLLSYLIGILLATYFMRSSIIFKVLAVFEILMVIIVNYIFNNYRKEI